MTNYQKIIRRVIAIILLLFAIVWTAILTFQVMAGDPTATFTTTEKIRMTIIYTNIFIIFIMGILPFFSRHRPVLIADFVLAIISIVFWIAFWWGVISIINIVFLLAAAALSYWQFASNKKRVKQA